MRNGILVLVCLVTVAQWACVTTEQMRPGLEGTVVDQAGRPVGGAVVEACTAGIREAGCSYRGETHTAADGRFVLPRATRRFLRLIASPGDWRRVELVVCTKSGRSVAYSGTFRAFHDGDVRFDRPRDNTNWEYVGPSQRLAKHRSPIVIEGTPMLLISPESALEASCLSSVRERR